jgi:hypothetical protein
MLSQEKKENKGSDQGSQQSREGSEGYAKLHTPKPSVSQETKDLIRAAEVQSVRIAENDFVKHLDKFQMSSYPSLKIQEIVGARREADKEDNYIDIQWKIDTNNGSFYMKFTSPVSGGKPGAAISQTQFTGEIEPVVRKILEEKFTKDQIDRFYGEQKPTDSGISVRDFIGRSSESVKMRASNPALEKIVGDPEAAKLLRDVVKLNDNAHEEFEKKFAPIREYLLE